MALSKRTRAKRLATAEDIVDTDGHVVAYAQGVTGPHPTTSMLVMLGTLGLVVLVLVVTTGQYVIPGALAIWTARYYLNGPRGVAVTDRGVALMRGSFWTLKPTVVLAKVPLTTLEPTRETENFVCLDFFVEHVWLSKKEFAALSENHWRPAIASHELRQP